MDFVDWCIMCHCNGETVDHLLFHCGKAGAGLVTKQINSYIAYCSYIGRCEGGSMASR